MAGYVLSAIAGTGALPNGPLKTATSNACHALTNIGRHA